MDNPKIIKQVADDFIKQLKVFPRITKKPTAIAVVGLVGSGKSTTAKELARLIKAIVLEDGAIRVILGKKRQSYEPSRAIVRQATLYVFRKGGNVILDSDFQDPQKRKRIEAVVKKAKGQIFYIRTVADRDEMIKRLINTKYDPNRSILKNNVIAIREMWRRTPLHYRWENKKGGRFVLRKLRIPFLAEIETDKDLKGQLKKVAQKIKKM